MAGRHLSPASFSRLASEVEQTMFAWLITGTPGKEYERRIIDAAHALREIKAADSDTFAAFLQKHLVAERASLSREFDLALKGLSTHNVRAFRLRYLLAKLTQHVDLAAYGPSDSRNRLADYTTGGNDIEHILPNKGHVLALAEFGHRAEDQELIQSLGNLLLIEKSINRAISNGEYTGKVVAYRQSKFLLTKCQADTASAEVGLADRITTTVQSLECWPEWNESAVIKRQAFLTKLAQDVFDVPPPASRSEIEAA